MMTMFRMSSLEMTVRLMDVKVGLGKTLKFLISLPARKTWELMSQVGLMIRTVVSIE